ncbi:hypothetical protein Ddc_11724 [Ditylenchus destructor]|nr:hypothetical protein Ddc_11724 [Ditylenchus destructor]
MPEIGEQREGSKYLGHTDVVQLMLNSIIMNAGFNLRLILAGPKTVKSRLDCVSPKELAVEFVLLPYDTNLERNRDWGRESGQYAPRQINISASEVPTTQDRFIFA